MSQCACGSKKTLNKCCGPLISGKKIPAKPEALMRARYTAYTLGEIDYIYDTMRGASRKGFSRRVAAYWASQVQWIKLEVIKAKEPKSDEAQVEFKAYYRFQDKEVCLHETSFYLRKKGQWFYVDCIDHTEKITSSEVQ